MHYQLMHHWATSSLSSWSLIHLRGHFLIIHRTYVVIWLWPPAWLTCRAESDTRRCGCTFLLIVRVSTGPHTFFWISLRSKEKTLVTCFALWETLGFLYIIYIPGTIDGKECVQLIYIGHWFDDKIIYPYVP